MRTILKLQALPAWIVSHLLPHSSVILLASDGLSTSASTRTLFWSSSQSSKPFFLRILEIFRPLLTISGVRLEGTPSTSWKRPETRHHTSNTSNPSWQSLILLGPPMSLLWFFYFRKGLKSSIKVEIEQQYRALTSFKEMV